MFKHQSWLESKNPEQSSTSLIEETVSIELTVTFTIKIFIEKATLQFCETDQSRDAKLETIIFQGINSFFLCFFYC